MNRTHTHRPKEGENAMNRSKTPAQKAHGGIHMPRMMATVLIAMVMAATVPASGAIITTVTKGTNSTTGTPNFTAGPFGNLGQVPMPVTGDLAEGSGVTITANASQVSGNFSLAALNDGIFNSIDAGERMLFNNSTSRLSFVIDLGTVAAIGEINSYSAHRSGQASRAHQVYSLYAATGTESGFVPMIAVNSDPLTQGWMLIGSVNTRPAGADDSSSVRNDHSDTGVSWTSTTGMIGEYRYLLFETQHSSRDGTQGQGTVWHEVDVIVVPEPSALALAGLGLALALGRRRRVER
jgi:hypothetical protein